MHIKLTFDHRTSDHAGAGGMYQIETVINADTGEDLTSRVDVGLYFSDENYEELLRYLKTVFGPNVSVIQENPEDHPDYPFK